MKRGAVTLKQITQVQLTANLNIFDLLDTGNFYLRLEERRNTVTSLLEQHKVKKDGAVYNGIVNNLEYHWIRDLIGSTFHEFSRDIDLIDFTPKQLSITHEEFQKVVAGIFYLFLDDILAKHLSGYIKCKDTISERDCIAVAGCSAEMERLGMFLGFPKFNKEQLSKRQSQIATKRKGTKGEVNHAIERICQSIESTSYNDFIKAISDDFEGMQDSELVKDLYNSFNNPIDIHNFQLEDDFLKFQYRNGKDDERRVTTIKNILSKINL